MGSTTFKQAVLILGAGSNVGSSVASLFAQKGYRVALAARRLQDNTDSDGNLNIQADFSDPKSIDGVFDKVEESFGSVNVVVYNGMYNVLSR